MRRHHCLLTLPACLLLAACSLTRSPFEPPATAWPDAWQHGGGKTATPANSTPWWQDFHDPAMDSAIDLAMARNNDLALAALRSQQAWLSADLAGHNRWPTPSASFDTSASRATNRSDGISRSYSTSVGFRYQLDLWGELAHTHDARRWQAQASDEDRTAVQLTLSGSVASLYWKLGYLAEQLKLADDSIAWAQRTLTLVQSQFRAGRVGKLEVLSAERTLASQQASRVQLAQQQVETRTAYALLFDQPPFDQPLQGSDDLPFPQHLPTGELPALAAGLPAALLDNRPDLRAARLRLHATLAEGDAVRASYYPDIQLTGSLGSASTVLGEVLKNPVAVLGAGIDLPFLDVRGMQLNRRLADNSYQQAVVNYRQTLYNALGEVENSLAASSHYAEQTAWLTESLAAARGAEKVYETRYRTGAGALKDWLDAQETRRQAESALLENHYQRLLAHATAWLALGGR